MAKIRQARVLINHHNRTTNNGGVYLQSMHSISVDSIQIEALMFADAATCKLQPLEPKATDIDAEADQNG